MLYLASCSDGCWPETTPNWESNELDWAQPGERRVGPTRVGGWRIAVLSHCNTITLSRSALQIMVKNEDQANASQGACTCYMATG